jgi:biotin operon repressor
MRLPTSFDGETYDPERDGERLSTMLRAVQLQMSDGRWHTLAELSLKVGGSEAAISARLRDLRKPRFGGHTVERRYVDRGLWEYRYIERAARQ